MLTIQTLYTVCIVHIQDTVGNGGHLKRTSIRLRVASQLDDADDDARARVVRVASQLDDFDWC